VRPARGCRWPGCLERTDKWHQMCRSHWLSLPLATRDQAGERKYGWRDGAAAGEYLNSAISARLHAQREKKHDEHD